jgi:hypothetical protein
MNWPVAAQLQSLASLAHHLVTLWGWLVANAPVQNVGSVQCKVAYEYELAPSELLVEVPIVLIPRTDIEDRVLEALASTVYNWFAQNVPKGGGRLLLHIMVYSGGMHMALPMMVFTRLTLPITSVVPPLKVPP